MHSTQMSIKVAREDRLRDEPRRALRIVCRPRMQVMFDTLLIGGTDENGEPVVNEMTVYESDVPKVQTLIETELGVIAECETWVENEWQKMLKNSMDERGNSSLVRSADFNESVPAEFERRMRRSIHPLVSVELGEQLPSPVAVARQQRAEADGAALDMLAAKVAERMTAGRRGDEHRRQ